MTDEEKNEVIKDIYFGIRSVAFRHARSAEQAKDFLQEALMRVLVVLPKYANKPPQELRKLLAKCAFNRIITLQTKSVHEYIRWSFSEDGEIPSHEFYDMVELDNLVNVLRSRLSAIARQVLNERLSPSDELLQIIENERKEKGIARQNGKQVIMTDRVRDVHIAAVLKLSKATISRASKEIEREGAFLLHNQTVPPT